MSYYTKCQTCQSKFSFRYLPKCSTCEKASCPKCSACGCMYYTKSLNPNISTKEINILKINEIGGTKSTSNIEINGTLSPLISQKPISSISGKMVISEFEFSDETGKLPIIFWGPVPSEIFPYRYEFLINITITGVNAKFFNNKLHLYVPSSARIHFNKSIKNRSSQLLPYLMSSS